MFTLYLICFLAGVGFSALSLLTMFAQGFHHTGFHHSPSHGHAVHHGTAHGHANGHGNAQHAQHTATAQSQNGVIKATAERAVAEVASAASTGTPWIARLNITALVLFLAIFGGVGLLFEDKHQLTSIFAAVIAAACGLAGSAVVNRLLGAMIARERPLEPVTFTGTLAQVIMPIRDGGGTGEIVYTLDGTRRCSGARSDDGRGINKGSEVVIVRYDKGIAYVAAFDETNQPPTITLH